MPANRVDLVNIFQTVTQALEQNQQALDQADTFNKDHGDNMVQTFQTITSALEKKKSGTDGAALSYAAKTLAKKANSGSSKLYAQNLAEAAAQFKGKKVDQKGALQLLQTLIGGGGSGSGGGDALGSLLGGLTGGGSSAGSSGGGDLLGSLLGSLVSGGGLQSLVQSFLGGSKVASSSDHRAQSTEVVIQSFLQALGGK